MNYFKDCTSLDEVKKLYRELAKKLHPDHGGSTEAMQLLNREYSTAIKKIAKGESLNNDDYEKKVRLSEAYQQAIEKIIGCQGFNIELVGNWIWVTGNTYPARTALKEAGYLFASKKVAWYFRTDEFKVQNFGLKLSLEQIKAKYGSEKITQANNTSNHYLHS